MSGAGSEAGRLCWVGGLPAHYTRALHRALHQRHGERLRFVYVGGDGGGPSRWYETGALPETAAVRAGSTDVEAAVAEARPGALVLAGHRPLELVGVARRAHRRGIPVAYWSDTNLHDVLRGPTWRRLAQRPVKRALLRRVSLLLHVGTQGRAYYLWLGGPSWASRLRLLPYPALIPDALPARGPGTDHLRVLYLGRLAPEKGVDRIIRALTRSPALAARAQLTVAGGGPERGRLEQMAGALPAGTVRFVGEIQSDQTDALYQDADVLVLPSHREPWGVVVNEALGHGVPVVTPRWVGAAEDLVVHEVTGLLLPDNDPDSVGEALLSLAARPEPVRRMGAAGFDLVQGGGWHLKGALAAFEAIMEEMLP